MTFVVLALFAVTTLACKALYLDFGTNIGVQIRKLYEPQFYSRAPVLGYFQKKFGPVHVRREQVCSFGFEGNPHRSPRLKQIEGVYRQNGWNVTIFTETIVGTAEREREFFGDGAMDKEEWGSSIFDHEHRGERFMVHERDTATLIRDLRLGWCDDPSNCLVIAKMDIEASEYDVIPHLIANKILCRDVVGEIFVEWHERLAPPEMKDTVQRIQTHLVQDLKSQNCIPTVFVDMDDESYLHDGAPLRAFDVVSAPTAPAAIENESALASPADCAAKKMGYSSIGQGVYLLCTGAMSQTFHVAKDGQIPASMRAMCPQSSVARIGESMSNRFGCERPFVLPDEESQLFLVARIETSHAPLIHHFLSHYMSNGIHSENILVLLTSNGNNTVQQLEYARHAIRLAGVHVVEWEGRDLESSHRHISALLREVRANDNVLWLNVDEFLDFGQNNVIENLEKPMSIPFYAEGHMIDRFARHDLSHAVRLHPNIHDQFPRRCAGLTDMLSKQMQRPRIVLTSGALRIDAQRRRLQGTAAQRMDAIFEVDWFKWTTGIPKELQKRIKAGLTLCEYDTSR